MVEENTLHAKVIPAFLLSDQRVNKPKCFSPLPAGGDKLVYNPVVMDYCLFPKKPFP